VDPAKWNLVILNSPHYPKLKPISPGFTLLAFSVIYYQYLAISKYSVISNSPLFQTDFCFPWPKINSVHLYIK